MARFATRFWLVVLVLLGVLAIPAVAVPVFLTSEPGSNGFGDWALIEWPYAPLSSIISGSGWYAENNPNDPPQYDASSNDYIATGTWGGSGDSSNYGQWGTGPQWPTDCLYTAHFNYDSRNDLFYFHHVVAAGTVHFYGGPYYASITLP